MNKVIEKLETEYGTYLTSIHCLTKSFDLLGKSKKEVKEYFDWVENKKMPLYEMLKRGVVTEPREEQKLYLQLREKFYPNESED